MPGRVAITGFYETSYQPEKKEQHITELVYEAVQGALEHAGAGIGQIDNVVSCSQDFLDGRTISNRTIPEVEGAYLKSEAKVAGDGVQAVSFAAMRVMSGKYRTALVVSHSKMSEGEQRVISNAMYDPLYQRHIGVDDISAAALQARAYLSKHGLPEDALGLPAAHSINSAAGNPLYHRGMECGPDKVMKSAMLASPLRELMAMPESDGACALVLADEDTARKMTDKPVWIAGMGTSTEAFYLGDRDLWKSTALHEAAQRAYSAAGIKDPARETRLVELSDLFAHIPLMGLEAMGFAEPGRGVELFHSGLCARDGRFPLDPAGGVLAGAPLCVAGMSRVIGCARQIRKEAGQFQAGEPDTALAQGSWGPAGQIQCVIVLKKD